MPKLLRRHVDAVMQVESFDDLLCERRLALLGAHLGDEEVAIWFGAEAGQDMLPIPAKAAGDIIRNIDSYVLPLGLRVLRRDVPRDQLLSFADVESPADGLVPRLWREQNDRWPIELRAAQGERQPASAGVAR